MMDTFRTDRNDLLGQEMIKKLAQRNMTGYYVKSKEEALELALSLIPEGSKVCRGGSMSVKGIGLDDALFAGNYEYVCRDVLPADQKREGALYAYDCDVFLSSCNAITKDGVLVNIDGNSNRVSAIAFGPKKVIFIVGMNKVTADVDSAIKRARNEAATINVHRFGLNTPCMKTGSCVDCLNPDTICCQFLITRYSKHNDRIHVILVDENLGF